MTVLENLKERYVNTELYTIHVDEEDGVATFILYDLSGALSGYQQYRPSAEKVRNNHPRESRYFTYRIPTRLPVFGLETFYWSNELYITEGIFDCVRLHNLGYSAIATLSNDPKHLSSWFRTLSRPLFGICDSGDAGKKLKKFCHHSVTCPEGYDLGSMTEENIIKLLDNRQF